MIRNHARLILALSVFLLSFVALDLVSLTKDFNPQTIQPNEKIDLVQAVNDLGKVLGGTPSWNVVVKDKVTSTQITDATFYIACSDGSFQIIFIYASDYKANRAGQMACDDASTPTLTVVKTGYKTNSGIDLSSSGDENSPMVINLEPETVATGTTTTTTKKSTSKTTSTKVETIKDVKLPDEFKVAGTATTDLSTISDSTKVSDLKLESTENTIKFNQTVDLSSTDTKDKFKKLDTYVHLDKVGVVSIDSVNILPLNKPATITMKNLPYVKLPRVLVNGRVDSSVVSNIHYLNGTLTFDVTHFSTFMAAPTVGITDPADKLETKDNPITLRGTVSDPTASVSAKLNNKDLGKLKIATASGIFEKQITLDEGANKIVVTALATNGTTAVASVSATLLKVVAVTSLMPYYIIAALLALIAALSFLFAVRALKKHHQPKKPGTGSGGSGTSSTPVPTPAESKSEAEPTPTEPLSINSGSSSGTPWENTPAPKVS